MVVLPVSEAVGVALAASKIAILMASADAPGYFEAYKAAAPVTWGVAIEVPLLDPYVL